MSAPDWRDVFAMALAGKPMPGDYDAVPVNEILPEPRSRYSFLATLYRDQADAILAAIAERGYRLHRDHDFVEDPDPGLRIVAFPGLALKCRRCGHRNSDLGMPTMSCEVGP